MQVESKTLPNLENCVTHYLGRELDLSVCLAASPDKCPHVMKFGRSFMCQHPERRTFEKRAPGGRGE